MVAKVLACCCVALMMAMPAQVFGQESLTAARELYATAEYHNALTMLGTLLAANPSPQERQSIELYRILCLFAIDRVSDAQSALEAMILRDPLYRPSMEAVPRRLRPAFSDTRKRLLPKIIQEKYVVAKTAFDRGEYKEADTGFTQVLMALEDPEIAAEADTAPLSDLRVLAKGFHDLAVKALAPAPSPPAPAVSTPAPVVAAPAGELRIFQAGDAGVTLPVTLRQNMPAFPLKLTTPKSGQLEIVIDETGAVESARILASVDPRYNALVLSAAKSWQYRPATVDGVRVKFRKIIQMTVTPER